MSSVELKKLNKELCNLHAQYEILNQQAKDLRDKFKAEFPAKSCPVFLYRDPKYAKNPLHWRYSSTIKGKVGDRIKTNFNTGKQSDFWEVVAPMSIESKAKLYEMELSRINLNYEMGILVAKVDKLIKYIKEYSEWNENIRTLK